MKTWLYCQGRRFCKLLFLLILLNTCTGIFNLQAQARKQGDHRLTLSGRQIPLKEVFYAIRQQTGLQLFYSNEQLNAEEKVTVQFNNTPLDDALRQLLSAKGFQWIYREEAIVIRQKKKVGNETTANDSISIPRMTISGKVTSLDGTPIPGATVFVKGTARGAVTDTTGRFSISNMTAVKSAVLVVSAIGMVTREIPLSKEMGKTENLSFALETAINSLDEQVVIAYGTTTKRMLTGSVGRITLRDIESQPVSNPLQALEGRVAGVFITQNTGLPGGNFKVEIRGKNTISSGREPFYVIDGVPFTALPLTNDFSAGEGSGLGASRSASPLNSINPLDIESIEVLKDADATAIYGSRAANGVVLITTRKGKPGKTTVDANVYYGWSKAARLMKQLDTKQYLEMRREALRNDGATPQPTDYDLVAWDSTRYTNWEKKLLGGTARTVNAHVTISGGNMNTRFLISGGYNRQTTVFPGDFSYRRASSHFNISHTSTNQRFSITFSGNYGVENNNLLNADLTYYAITPPNAPEIYNDNGKLNWGNGTFDNPFAALLRKYKADTRSLISRATASYEVFTGLQLKANLGYTDIRMDENMIRPSTSFMPGSSDATGQSIFGNSSATSWILEPQAVYQRKLGLGQLEALAGTTFQEDIADRKEITGFGYTSDALLQNLHAAGYTIVSGARYTRYRYNAVFARINYNWQGKYIMNLTGRRDGSSRFGPASRFANFGAVGLAWIFTKERFAEEGWPLLSFGKLRASYGITGNDQIGDYEYLDTYTALQGYLDKTDLMPSRLFNANYGWESNKKLEVALELGLLNDRILLTTMYYRNRSSNLLIDYSLPGTTGFPSIQKNLDALIGNTGWEFELNTVNAKNNTLTWITTFVLSIPRTRLLAFPDLDNSAYRFQYTVGQPLTIFKGYHFLGVDPETGVYQVEDMNRDGKITSPEDRTYIKKMGADFYGNLQNRLEYKEWQLDFSLQFVKQIAGNHLYEILPGYVGTNQPVEVLNRWQKPGDHTNMQMYTQTFASPAGSAYFLGGASDQRISDASYLRLRNLSLSWQLPPKWRRSLHLQAGRIYIEGQNLLTITNYAGRDPENGEYLTALPPLRTLTVGAQLVF